MAANELKPGLKRLYILRDLRAKALQQAESVPLKQVQLELPLLRASLKDIERFIECVEQGLPYVISCWANAPELYVAMDVFFGAISISYMGIDYDTHLKDLARADQLGLPPDLCTVHRLVIRSIEDGDVPIPKAICGILEPCDGMPLVQNTLTQHKDWVDIPFFAPDPPYVETDPRAIPYFGNEFRRLAAFLEKHLGKRLDMDRFRELIEESNKQVRMFMEYNELKRAVPCPVPSFSGAALVSAIMGMYTTVGRPETTDYIRQKLAFTEEMVKEKKGAIPNEKIRLYWFDLAPGYYPGGVAALAAWLAQEWGAVVVQDFMSDCPFTPIDTSTEDSMFQGLAKRSLLDAHMIRQSRGRADIMLDDLTRVVKNFKIDCVIHAIHMGHKDQSANVGLVRDACRELGVPVLQFTLDILDPRYTPLEEVKEKISQFFRAMGLG